MTGWICLSRKILSCWVWKDKPFSKAQAWIDLLLLASHEDTKFLLGNELVEIKRGAFVTSEVKLSERWGWSRTKTRNYLFLLESDNMISKKSDSKKTVITIVNYGLYQDIQTTEKQRENSEKTAKKQQKNTINNLNNDNNVNNNKERAVFKPPTVEEVKAYCQERGNNIDAESFVAFYESKGWMIGKNKMKSWKSAITTWEKRDNKPKATPTTKFSNFEERNYNFSELEKKFARN